MPDATAEFRSHSAFHSRSGGYIAAMLYTILIILAIIALALFILGRR